MFKCPSILQHISVQQNMSTVDEFHCFLCLIIISKTGQTHNLLRPTFKMHLKIEGLGGKNQISNNFTTRRDYWLIYIFETRLAKMNE